MPQPAGLPLAAFYRGRALNFAHRGAREEAPENTLPAFLRAAALGADGVELDAQLSACGVPVIIHDFTLERTTDGTGPVGMMPLAALRELDAGARFSPEFTGTPIPTLDEVLEVVGQRLLVNVELKFSSPVGAGAMRLARAVVEVIRRHGLSKRVLCSSFNPLALRALRRIAPDLPVGFLVAPDQPLLARGRLAHLVAGKHEARHPHFSMITPGYVAWAHRAGYRVNTWTVNEADDINRMVQLGVDAIISDRPGVVRGILRPTG